MDQNSFNNSDYQPAPPPPPPIPAFEQPYSPAPEHAAQHHQPHHGHHVAPAAPQALNVPPLAAPLDVVPQPVVQVLSPRGVEYAFLTIALFTGAIGLVSALLVLVNGETGFEVLSFPVALLLVSLPIFAWLFLRLKNAELANPALRLDASKRRSTQLIQIVTFMVSFFTLIGFLTFIFAKVGGSYDGSLVKVFLNVLVILLVSGGILTYYWRDEHRQA